MPTNCDEERVRTMLEKYGFRCERFSRKEHAVGKTTDFQIFQGAAFRFYCEVKGIVPDLWLDRLLDRMPPMTLEGGSRNDPVYNRIADDIHQAVQQFDAVNPSLEQPNVLAFSNSPGSHCNYGDLLSVLTGQFFADSGRRFPMFTRYSEGRIREEKLRVNLYIWIEDDEHQYFFFPNINREHERNICKWFGKDPNTIPILEV